MNRLAQAALLACCTSGLMLGCGGGSSSPGNTGSDGGPVAGNPGTTPPPTTPPGPATPDNQEPVQRVVTIAPGVNASNDAVAAFVAARPGDVIKFECGFFDIRQTLLLSGTENIRIEGCGKDETVLSFKDSGGIEGFLINNVRGVTIEGLTAADSAGNGFELRSVDHGTLSDVRAFWSSDGGRESADPVTADNFQEAGRLNVACENPMPINPNVPENMAAAQALPQPPYTVNDAAGRYGIYPVKSKNILVKDSESIGASDAGIYVGQTNNAIIRDSRAAYNVFGFEIENVQGGEYIDNVAECNTGGFLIYDLDFITQYGQRSRMHGNKSDRNNTYNFTEGGFVSNVPSGSGMITLSYDRIDVFENEFTNNNTAGIIHASYELFPEGAGRPSDNKIDFYTEGLRIFNNTFVDNGNNLPAPNSEDLSNQDVAKLLPAVVGFKNQAACGQSPTSCPPPSDPNNAQAAGGFRGAHIIWDGLLDPLDADCPFPKDANGNDVPTHDGLYEGKPEHTSEHPNPDCHYNAYKFTINETGVQRRNPLFWSNCIDDNNSFSGDSITFANFKGLKGVNAAIALSSQAAPTLQDFQEIEDFPSSFDRAPHDCLAAYNAELELLEPVVIPEFVPSPAEDILSDEEVAALCGAAVGAGQVNWDAHIADCPRLDQYNLFADAQDPTSAPNGGGVPYALNTKLFSDYSVKYRVAYMPPNTRATYMDSADGSQENATLIYPAGTIIAKTFSFLNNGSEKAIETRLLIKRENANGDRWAALPYVWEEDGAGNRVAILRPLGSTQTVAWDYADKDSGRRNMGTTEYVTPTANQCFTCHQNFDNDRGSAPIGPKVRNLNRPFDTESSVVTGQSQHESAGLNQIKYLCDQGLLAGCPSDLGVDTTTQIATNLEKTPVFNVPGSAGFAAGSDEDIEARSRAWLEVNCAHCHNDQGNAANTGFFVDVFRPVNGSHGICKGPTAAGAEGSGGREVDIHPGMADLSILEFRISEDADTPAARMPPIARSVVDVEAHALITNWINNVIVADEEEYPGSTNCTNNGGEGPVF